MGAYTLGVMSNSIPRWSVLIVNSPTCNGRSSFLSIGCGPPPRHALVMHPYSCIQTPTQPHTRDLCLRLFAHGSLATSMLWHLVVKDRRRRPEGGEWESIKITHRNLDYILKSTRCPSLLTRLRPSSYRQAISPRNQARNYSGNTN
jgi:hypothetical protein